MVRFTMVSVVLLLIPFTALAKDATKTPDSARVSNTSPAIEGSAANKSDDAKQAPLPLPLPVRIVEEPPESDDAEYRAARASNNEDQDLKAQQSMASSAEAQLRATYFLLGVSIIGTLFVVLTVIETRKAADAAWRSVDIAQESVALARKNGEKQLRAYVNIVSAKISFQGNVPTVHLESKNFGQTPARQIVFWCDLSVGDLDLQFTRILKQTASAQKFEHGVMGPTSTIRMQLIVVAQLSADAVGKMQEGTKAFYVWGEISYIDAFNQPQTTKFRYVIMGREWLTNTDLGICHEGNDAT